MIKVVEYKEQYEKEAKNLLVQLQKHLVELDNEKIRILTDKYEDKYLEYIINLAKDNNGKLFIALSDNNVVGLTMGYILENTTDDKLRTSCPKIGKISKLIVDENLRQSGIGQVLIKKVEEYLKDIGCEYITIEVFDNNEGAYKLYNKNGYVTRIHNLMKKIN